MDYPEPHDRLVYNAIRTPDGTVLVSYNRHDYKTYIDANGHEYMVDGGLDYCRRNVVEEAPAEELTVHFSAGHDKVREVLSWGTRGISGHEPLRYVTLCDMDTDHIKAILMNYSLSPEYTQSFTTELLHRGESLRTIHG